MIHYVGKYNTVTKCYIEIGFMSMNLSNIERNQLDYILTDVIPFEISDLFSYRYFYDFLNNNYDEIKSISESIINSKNKNNVVFCNSNYWKSIPLIYSIKKSTHTERTISLIHPLGAVQLFLFVRAYQKEILSILQKNSIFSIRYHKRNNELVYKNKNKAVTKYFSDLSDITTSELIEQTGMYFNIGPYKSIAAFTSSEEWLVLNSKYKFFVRTDYKSCFDSIYTHTFNWIVGKDVNDTIKFKNGSVYATIDNVLMNINARTSNGIVVGPEFSRMVAEILLQTIDRAVFCNLLNKKIYLNENYNVYRFVDDIFIFADSEKLADEIVELFSESARKYLLILNDSKLYRNKVPFVLDPWLNDTNMFSNRACYLLFYSKNESSSHVENISDENNTCLPHLIKSRSVSISKRSIMNQFNELICKYEEKNKTIVAYFLGTLLNKVGRNKEKVRIFKENVKESVVFNFLDLVFYIYSFYPDFNNTQRFISIVSYVKDEFDIFEEREKLQTLFERYSFVIEKANLNDIVNLILFCCQAKIEIPFKQEKIIEQQLIEKDDPLLWATYLIYSQYSKRYYNNIKEQIITLLNERLDSIIQIKNIFTYREFWWVLIFNKSPHLQISEQSKIDKVISNISINTSNGDPGDRLGKLFLEFLKKSDVQFFEWNIQNKDFLRNLTFKTRQRTVFRNYQENLSSLYWSSI